MLAGTPNSGLIPVIKMYQVLMTLLRSPGKSILSVKHLVRAMVPERMRGLNVTKLTPLTRIIGSAIG